MRSSICKGTAGLGVRVTSAALVFFVFIATSMSASTSGVCLAAPKASAVNMARAKALLVEGSNFMDAGEYASALEKFEAAFEVVPSPKIHYNFGQAYDGMGKPAEALDAFRRFVKEAPDAAPVNIAKAKTLIAALEKRAAVLVLTGEVDGATVSVDGRPYQVRSDREILINPGLHSVSAERPGAVPFLANINAGAGERVQVVVRFAGNPMVEPPRAGSDGPGDRGRSSGDPIVTGGTGEGEPAGTEPRRAPNQRPWQKPVALTAAAVAIVAGGVGLVGLTQANAKADKFNDAHDNLMCSREAENGFGDEECKPLLDEWESKRSLMIGAFVGAGVLAAASAVLFLTLPEPRKEPQLACAPSLFTPGAACALRF